MWPAVVIEFLKVYFKNPKEWTHAFRFLVPVMLLVTLSGQNDIKKEIVEGKTELKQQISIVDKKIDVANEKREVILRDYNDWRRETEGRLSFLEAGNGARKRTRPF